MHRLLDARDGGWRAAAPKVLKILATHFYMILCNKYVFIFFLWDGNILLFSVCLHQIFWSGGRGMVYNLHPQMFSLTRHSYIQLHALLVHLKCTKFSFCYGSVPWTTKQQAWKRKREQRKGGNGRENGYLKGAPHI